MKYRFEYKHNIFWLYGKEHWWLPWKKLRWCDIHGSFTYGKENRQFVTFKNYKEIFNGFLLDPSRYPTMIIMI